MSEISKARQRMLHKREGSHSPDEIAQKAYPRKFTLSSLTQQLQHRPSQPQIHLNEFHHSPTNNGHFPEYTRTQRSKTEHSRPDISYNMPLEEVLFSRTPYQTPQQTSKTHRSYANRSKENPPLMFKTVNIKINEISHLHPLSQVSQDEEFQMDSHFQESPPRVQYKRKLHNNKLDLVLVPPFERRHHSPFKPRQTLKKWAEDTIAEAKNLGRSFVDDFFPPARTIIFNRKILYQEEGLKFQRLSRIYNCQSKLVDACEPTLLSLGKYTNPYLFSALSILAEEPVRVLSLFSNQQATEDGAYHISLCKDGTWRYIIVDDFVPIKSIAGRKQMLFIHSREDEAGVELWPALIEKAIAKIYGTYLDLAMIREDGMSELFRILTGAPVSTYPLNKDFRSFLIIIDAALKRGHVVTVQAVHEEHVQTAKLRGLAVHQAYKVLQIKKSGLKLRNYAESELTTKLTFAECLIFSKLVIYRLEPSFRYISYKLRHKKHYYSKLNLTVPTTTRGYFDTWQNNPAYYKKHLGSNINYSTSRVRMWLNRTDKEEEEGGEWIQPGKEVILEEGKYELKVHLCQQRQFDFTVSYYGQKDILMSRQKCCEEWYQPCLCISN